MFTDGPLTPLRLEALISLLRENSPRGMPRDALRKLLQPLPLPAVTEQSWKSMTDGGIRAGEELGLLHVDDEIHLTDAAKGRRSVRECVLHAIDEHVLGTTDVEWYFASFYSYVLGLGPDATTRTNVDWVDSFRRQVPDTHGNSNPFNKDKLSGLNRWFVYAGLGWWDSSENFVCNPYDRLLRRFPLIFHDHRKLDDHAFFDRMAMHCPELDGGAIFAAANPSFDPKTKEATLGVSNALLEMHDLGIVRLHAYPDSGGWSIRSASPSDDGATLRSDRLAQVEWLEKRRAA